MSPSPLLAGRGDVPQAFAEFTYHVTVQWC
jgi:hypothetical protein